MQKKIKFKKMIKYILFVVLILISLFIYLYLNHNLTFYDYFNKISKLRNVTFEQNVQIKDLDKNYQIKINGNIDKNGSISAKLFNNNNNNLTDLIYDNKTKIIYIDLNKLQTYLLDNKFIDKEFANEKFFKINISNISFLSPINDIKTIIKSQLKSDMFINTKNESSIIINENQFLNFINNTSPSVKIDLNLLYNNVIKIYPNISSDNYNLKDYINNIVDSFIKKLNDSTNQKLNYTINKKLKYQNFSITNNNLIIKSNIKFTKNNNININTEFNNCFNLEDFNINTYNVTNSYIDKNTSADTYHKEIEIKKTNETNLNNKLTDIENKLKNENYINLSIKENSGYTSIYSSKNSSSNSLDYINDEINVDVNGSSIINMNIIKTYSLVDFQNYMTYLITDMKNTVSNISNIKYTMDNMVFTKDDIKNGFKNNWTEYDSFKKYKFNYSINIENDIVTFNLSLKIN